MASALWRSPAWTLACLLLGACGGAPPSLDVLPSEPPSDVVAGRMPARKHSNGSDSCPLTISGARADIENSGSGLTITVSAAADQLLLLRARAHALPDVHGGLAAACPCALTGEAASAPPADISVDDLEGGVRLVVTAKDPADTANLRSALRGQLSRVHGGDCSAP
ncbi:MAG TPA: hypothetical protein VMI75_26075 [Polyangiaceae bacterium]|nr:hypothetical protein [Polyangiaceae bacterium]